MPPTKDALYLHIQHANYQCQQWKKALVHHPLHPHPIEHVWTDIDGPLVVNWELLEPSPDSTVEFVSCSCKKWECTTNHCDCAVVNLPHTYLCGCNKCKRTNSQEQVGINEILNDDDDLAEYQDKDTNGEVDDYSDSSEDEFFGNYEIRND